MSDPRGWKVSQDDEGFFLEDEYGEDMTPTRRFTRVKDAKEYQDKAVDNYEPPTGAPQDDPDFAGYCDNN